MEITFSKEILEKMKTLSADRGGQWVLDFDHSLSRENIFSDCCGITRYRLVLIDRDQLPDVFDGQLTSSLGPIYFKQWGAMYLADKISVRLTDIGLIELVSPGELIAPNMEIVDFRNEKILSVS